MFAYDADMGGGGEHVHISYDLNHHCGEDSVSEVNSHPSPDCTYSGLQLVVNVYVLM